MTSLQLVALFSEVVELLGGRDLTEEVSLWGWGFKIHSPTLPVEINKCSQAPAISMQAASATTALPPP